MRSPYDETFYEDQAEGSLRSARAIVPILLGLSPVRSVVDFGCGRGTWLRAFEEHGVAELRGYDGEYIDRARLRIAAGSFTPADLTRVVRVDSPFDLAVSLEVGEHLPTRASESLVESLTSASTLVLFSAAVPGQGGTHHVNEQWPSFWQGLFRRRGYLKVDSIRPRVWGRDDVEWWYRQNVVLYASEDRIDRSEALRADRRATLEANMEFLSAEVLDNFTSFPHLFKSAWHAGLRALRRRAAC
jgi:SAM-dependent methyltransferase